MRVESIAECPLVAFRNTFNLHEAILGLENQLLVFLEWSFLKVFQYSQNVLI